MNGSAFMSRYVLSALAAVAFAAAAFANEKSSGLVGDAHKKLRQRDAAGALKSATDAVAADPGDGDAQTLLQDILRRDKPEKDLLAQYRAAAAAKPDDPMLAWLAARLLKPDDAAREFGLLAQKFPDSPWPHDGRAVAFAALGRWKEAAAEHDAAIDAGPREPCFRVSQARTHEAAGEWPQAVESWKLAVGMRPNDRLFLLGLGEALRRSALLDDAVVQFEAAAKLDPSDPEAPYRIGLARMDAGRDDEALKSLDAAIALDKLYMDAYAAAVRAAVGRARAAAASAKRDLVEADFAPAIGYGTRAVQADGASAAAHTVAGHAQEAASDVASAHAEDAVREYDAAVGLLPVTDAARVEALVGKAHALLVLGRWDESVAVADQALLQDEKCATAYLTAGRALQGKGVPEDALKKYYGPGLKACPDDNALRHARAIVLWQDGKTGDAKKDLEAVTAAEPKNGRYQLTLGELYYDLKMYPQAEKAALVAADVRPRDPMAWRVLGRTCTSLKKYDQAAEAFEEVVKLVEGVPPDPAPAPDAGGQPGGQPAGQPGGQPAGQPGGQPAGQPGGQPPAQPGGQPATPAPQPPEGGTPAPAPAPAPSDPNAPAKDPGGNAPAAPAADPKHAKAEHLYLTLIYADHLNDKEKAKVHARKWLDEGGTDPNIDSWIQDLLADK
jgi:tetratricopeptide (TPR) repeat protein